MGLPVGYHFEPEDHELVNYYLVNRIKNGVPWPHPYPRMPDVDVYRDHPYKTFWSLGASQSEDEESKRFFFTALEKVAKKGKTVGKEGSNINRKVACFGTWKGESKIPVVMIHNGDATLVGYKRNFTFSKAKDCPELDDIQEGCEWSMREYSLPEDQYDGNFVLCCITNKMAKAKNTGRDSRSSVMNVEDQENSIKVYTDHQQQRSKRVCVGGSSQFMYNNVQESGNCYNYEQKLQPAVWNNNNVNHTQQPGVTEPNWNNNAQQGSQPEFYRPVCNSGSQTNMVNAHNYSESNVGEHGLTIDELRYWSKSDDITSYMLNDILTFPQQQQMAMNMLHKPRGAMTPHP